MTVNSAIFGCAGPRLSAGEAAFFRDCNPWGFILFARNIETPAQVRKLCADLRKSVGRDALIFVDQEGGRVQRLGPPHWRKAPRASTFDRLYDHCPQKARRAAWLNFRLIAQELRDVGITADCAPVLDLPYNGSHRIISDRAFSVHPKIMNDLAHACMSGLTAGGVVPVIKHIPGHGRAKVDSHKSLPIIDASLSDLEASDFIPFKTFKQAPMAMTAHVLLTNADKDKPVTISKTAMKTIVRGALAYDGLVMSDDLDMKALKGGLTSLAQQTLAAGCDIALQCSGNLSAMVNVAKGIKPLSGKALRRAKVAEYMSDHIEPFDRGAALAEYSGLMDTLEPNT